MKKLLLLLFCIIGFAKQSFSEGIKVPKESWSFNGPIGTFDKASLQRGFQVFKEVCATCHSMKLVDYRNLREIGFSLPEVKALARQHELATLNDEGETIQRPAEPSDAFVSPFANEKAARAANNGSYPPDLSLIVKARTGGENYIKAMLLGFQDPPPGIVLNPGMYYNKYFSGHQTAMAPPLKDGMVVYADGTKATADQMAHDVVTFLAWAAEPELEIRKRLGIKVILYLAVFSALMYFLLRKIRAKIK